MFQVLAPLVAKTGTLTVIVTGNADRLTATVLPKPELSKEFPALGSGLSITQNPAELDAVFAQALRDFIPPYVDAFDQIASFKQETAKALADAREKSKKDAASASKSKYVPPKKSTPPVPPPLFADGAPAAGGSDEEADADGDADETFVGGTAADRPAAEADAPVKQAASVAPQLPQPKTDSDLPSLF